MNTEKSIDVLNSLIEINNDRIEGYEYATSDTDDTDLKILFSQCAQTSLKCRAELQDEVYKLGGTPVDSTSKPLNLWLDANSTLNGDGRKEILCSCEYGENFATNTYKEVLRNDFEVINPEQKVILKAQHISLKADFDKVRVLNARCVG